MIPDSLSISLFLVIITSVISYLAFNNRDLFEKLKHYPVAEAKNGEYYRFLSSGFVHGSMVHLLVNMYVLLMFGQVVEETLVQVFGATGRIVFVVMYLVGIIVADIPTFLKHKNNPAFASIGASGAVSAVVFVYILFYPWNMLSVFPLFFIKFPAIAGGIAYLMYTSWASRNKRDNIDHMAHFAGAIFGILFIFAIKPSMIPFFFEQIIDGLPF